MIVKVIRENKSSVFIGNGKVGEIVNKHLGYLTEVYSGVESYVVADYKDEESGKTELRIEFNGISIKLSDVLRVFIMNDDGKTIDKYENI